MKTAKVGSIEISMKWQYGVHNPQNLRPTQTKCTVTVDGSVEFEGIASRYYKDRFCKESARRSSLEYALAHCLDRQLRAAVWTAYWNRKPVKPAELK
jgi:hypothetical protein